MIKGEWLKLVIRVRGAEGGPGKVKMLGMGPRHQLIAFLSSTLVLAHINTRNGWKYSIKVDLGHSLAYF